MPDRVAAQGAIVPVEVPAKRMRQEHEPGFDSCDARDRCWRLSES
jgi:hypothetical protein